MQTEAGRFACETCGRRYRWKQELAGRTVKCTCGTVMSYPSEDPGDLLYDVAPRLERSEDGTVHVVGTVRVPQSAAPASGDVQPTLAYRAPRADHVGVEGYFPNKTIDLYAPLWLIGASTVVEFFAAFLIARGGTRPAAAAMASVGLQLVLGTVLMLGGVLLAAWMRGIKLGPFGGAVLKLAAVALAPDAMMILTGPFFHVLPIVGGLLNWAVGFILYFALLGLFFDLDQSDTWWCVIAIFLVKLAFVAAVMYGMFKFVGW